MSGKRALLFLADGFEETEAVSAADVLRRGGVSVCTASLAGRATVVGAHGISLVADRALPETLSPTLEFASEFDALVLPGGMGGTLALKADRRVLDALRAADARGAVVAAVCAAPWVLDEAGLLDSRRFCCYPGVEREFTGKGTYVTDVPTVRDGNVVTGTGPGTAALFAVEILRTLGLGDAAGSVAAAMLLR